MPVFQVTQRCYGYRRYRVNASDWQGAKQQLEEGCPRDAELASAELPETVALASSTLDDPQGVFFDEVVFVDSADGGTCFYEGDAGER